VLLKVPSGGDRASIVGLQRHILDELNVKAIEFVDEPAEVRTLSVQLKDRAAAGENADAVRKALGAADQERVARDVSAGGPVTLKVAGKEISLGPEDLRVDVKARGPLSVAEEGELLVAVDLTVTEDLRNEGMVRDLVRRIQKLRKDAGLSVDDRITTFLVAPSSVRSAVEDNHEYLLRETLTAELRLQPPPAGVADAVFTLGGEEVTVGVAPTSDAAS
jgi:isoleucyl-tRNA synthetase